MMKKILVIALAGLLAVSCFNRGGDSSTGSSGGRGSRGGGSKSAEIADNGELVGAKGRRSSWVSEKPFGMVLVHQGAFVLGKGENDLIAGNDAAPRTVTVSSIYMDDTEISNNEYREFVNWVRDSIFRQKLAQRALELNATTDEGIGYYRYVDIQQENNPYYEYMTRAYGSLNPNSPTGGRKIDWSRKLEWNKDKQRDINSVEVRDMMLIPMEARLSAELENRVDVSKLNYSYLVIDEERAAREKQPISKKYLEAREINVYPDTTVWVRDFNYSYNLPPLQKYFDSPAYDNYPVVGVNWNQANAFCNWRTKKKNAYQVQKGLPTLPAFRLPTEAEWEYAARGGLNQAMYPWGGPYLVDDRGCFLANFKPMRGNYLSDGEFRTAPVNAYNPNNFGLYNMSGNVAEWTNSSYDVSTSVFLASMNPNYDNPAEPRKVIKGGSWKDVSYYLQVGTRDFEVKDSSRSYIGFRTVQDHLGQLN